MKKFGALFLGLVFVSGSFAGEFGGLFHRRADRRAAKANCASCQTVSEVKETPAVIKTETIYKKVGEKVTIVPVESSAKKAK